MNSDVLSQQSADIYMFLNTSNRRSNLSSLFFQSSFIFIHIIIWQPGRYAWIRSHPRPLVNVPFVSSHQAPYIICCQRVPRWQHRYLSSTLLSRCSSMLSKTRDCHVNATWFLQNYHGPPRDNHVFSTKTVLLVMMRSLLYMRHMCLRILFVKRDWLANFRRFFVFDNYIHHIFSLLFLFYLLFFYSLS